MVNTINEFQERNKQLLEENENLKKQLTDKEQEFKLRILNAVNNVMENERSEIAGTLMTLQQHFWAWDEWVKVQKENGVEKATFSNEFTLENIVKGFTEWTWHSSDSFGFIYKENQKLEEKNTVLEEKVVGLEQTKQELEANQKELEKELEFEMASADCHLDAINTCKDWYFTHHVNPLNKELVNKSNLLSTKQKIIERKDEVIGELKSEIKTERELLRNARRKIEDQDKLIKLFEKPLPEIPSKPSKFKIFKSKIKTKFHHLVEKINHQNQELVAQVEVRN